MLLKRFVELVRQVKQPNGFDGYLNGIHRRGLPGEPTYEEAKRDFVYATKQESGYPLS